jgi:hypothetical protein
MKDCPITVVSSGGVGTRIRQDRIARCKGLLRSMQTDRAVKADLRFHSVNVRRTITILYDYNHDSRPPGEEHS